MTPKLLTEFDHILHHFSKMEIEKLANFLDDDLAYQEMECQLFIMMLSGAFRKFKEKGNFQLFPFPGFCKNETFERKENTVGYCFLGDRTPHYLPMIFQVEDGKVLGMYECSTMDHTDLLPQKTHRILINPHRHKDDDIPF